MKPKGVICEVCCSKSKSIRQLGNMLLCVDCYTAYAHNKYYKDWLQKIHNKTLNK